MDDRLVFGIYTDMALAYKDMHKAWVTDQYIRLVYDTYETYLNEQFTIYNLEPDKCYLEDELYG